MRIKLSEKFVNEREEICNKIISILNLDNNGCILLSELDLDIDKQNKIIELKEEIQNITKIK